MISSFFLINKEINEDLFIYFEKKIYNNPSLELFNETIIQPFKSIADIQNFNRKDKLNISTVPMRKITRNEVLKYYLNEIIFEIRKKQRL